MRASVARRGEHGTRADRGWSHRRDRPGIAPAARQQNGRDGQGTAEPCGQRPAPRQGRSETPPPCYRWNEPGLATRPLIWARRVQGTLSDRYVSLSVQSWALAVPCPLSFSPTTKLAATAAMPASRLLCSSRVTSTSTTPIASFWPTDA